MLRSIIVALTLLVSACALPRSDTTTTPVPRFVVAQRFAVSEARQGVAVDALHFYAVDNRGIGKYDKRTGGKVGSWDAGDDGAIVHLNSGVVVDGKLYCAHSNYPSIPMRSSIEVFDTELLVHTGTQALPDGYGSATWVDRIDDTWWVAFAHYHGRGGEPGKGPEATVLVRFDSAWKATAQYSFPPAVVARFATRSNSGGSWGGDGLLYATGHDGGEVFVLRRPREGAVLELVEIVPAPIDGQGIAWDRSLPATLYGIIKREREVVVLRQRPDQSVIEATSGK